MVVIVVGIIDLNNSHWSKSLTYQIGSYVALISIIIASLILLLSQNWRRYILGLVVMYLGVFWLVAISLPLGLAAVKLIVGWMAGAVLGASQIAPGLIYEKGQSLSGYLFRLLGVIFVWILCVSIAPIVSNWLPANQIVIIGGLILIGMGVLQIGMTTRPLRVVIGLLTMLAGFEVLYAIVESSVLVIGLLAIVNLGLALVGAYLLAIHPMEISS